MKAARPVPRIEAIHPLTPLQEGILFQSLAAPEAGLYVVQPVFELEGELDHGLLRGAAEAVVARHAALRTAFVWQGQERPRQVVHRQVEVPWEERDLRPLAAGAAPAALAAFLEEDRRRGLDPARAPLCRFALLRADDRRRWLVVTHHHLVLDGWSMPVVTRELAAAYAALSEGRPLDLPPARQFGDYTAWLARRPAGRDEAYWREALRGLRAPTPLAVDTAARAAEGGQPVTGRARSALPGAEAARLREFGRRQGLAFATLAQAAWALLLSRYSGERDVLFGLVVSGRGADLEGVEGIVGMFVNSLPVRARVPRRAPLLPWLRELQAALAGLREHEHCALAQVQAWSELPAGAPLFESLLAVQTLGPISPELRLPGLAIRPVAGEERVGLPLTAVAYPAPADGVWLGLEYDRRRVPPEAAGPLLEHYGRLLAGLSAASDVDAVPMVSAPPRPPAEACPDPLPGLAAALGVTAGDRVLAAAAPGSAEELLLARMAAAAGAAVVPPGAEAAATVAVGPPATWEAWARGLDLDRVLAVVSGEPAPPTLVEALAGRCRGLRSLAPEAICAGDPRRHAGLGGSPPPGLAARVLDAELRPLPDGVRGDVWLAGEALLRSWPDAPAPAPGRLRPDPLAPGGLMLRTGWRGRRRPDGDLELLGPDDGAELEWLLGRHPGVGRAVAVAGEAFVQPAPGAAPTAAELRAHLRRHLPAHLVPARVHVVDGLPLDAGGRVDRRAPGGAPAAGPAPPADDLLHRLAQAPAERRARFLARLRAELAAPDPDPGPRPRPPGAPAVPSFQQEQFWVLERLAGGESAHNLAFAVELPGPPDPAAVRAALEGLVARHEVLRCGLADAAGGLALEVVPAARPALAVTDLAPLPAAEREAEAARLAAEAARRPFDLAAPPLLRARLLLGPGASGRLLLAVPHVAADPAAARILVRDLLALEAAARTGAPADLPALPLQYADYARWQRERLERRRDALLAYWRQQLHGWQPLELATDRPRPPRLGPDGTGARLDLEPELVARLERAAPGAGLEAVLLAGYVELLRRWSGQADVLVGMGVDLRDRPELAAVLGDFGNHVALRVDAGGRPSLADLAGRAGRVLAEAREHRDLPFAALVEALQPARDPGRTPLFQVAFNFEQEAGGSGPGAVDAVDSGRIPYELALTCVRAAGGVRVALGGNRNLFEPATVRRMAGALRALLEGAAAAPGLPLDDLALLPAGQERELLAWAAGAAAPAPAAGLGALFAARAEAGPGALALTAGDRSLTYGELAARAARIAHALRRRGLGPEDRVAVLLERGPDMVAAVLGVLLAGAAYVPLDPGHPSARTALVVADAGARLALTQRSLAARLAGSACPALELDGDGALDGLPERPPPAPAGPEHLACVIYTSGSTGRPKGVLVEQGSVAGFADHIAAAYGVDGSSRLLGMAPLTFDLSVFELFTALLSGASLHLASEADRLQPDRLQRLMRERRVTVAELPPALMPALDPDGLPDLGLVSVGGEAFPGELVGRWARPDRRFVNGYGPTETTVAVTLRDCAGTWERMPPIGRPMPSHRVHVLDGRLRLVPVGVPGELCIGGAGLARGYQGRPDQTAERFVPDPFGPPGERLYRTSDRARWLASGELELLGRLDRQVKVRGHRVELGEVEAAIARLDGVREVAVAAVPDEAGRLQLAAYLAGGWRPDVPALRARLEAELPAYMLPSRVVHLERLPLTPRGKVDRAALPAPGPGEAAAEPAAPPRTWVEERIAAEIVGPLLQSGAVDVERNFFELGGNSLEAIQVVSRVAEAFEVEVDLGEFLAEPTVRRLGRLVEDAQAAGAGAGDLLAQILDEVEALSEAEAERLLEDLEDAGG